MTADDTTHREPVNPTGAHGNDVQQIVTLLRQRGGSATMDYLRSLTEYAEPRLRACLEELEEAGRIHVQPGYNSVDVELLEGDRNRPVVADGSGHLDDCELALTPSEVFEILSSTRRRRLITELSALTPQGEEAETHLKVGEIATSIAVARQGVTSEELSHDERHRAYVSLTQVHAESLEDYGVAEYHKRVKKITPTADIHALATIVEDVEAAAEAEV